ncbi:LuxR C-terminal-related transcriptional regulator [Microbacterium amylolyticum]|uniref:LuxR C-terminal-related transcriptional regulator n=1 Tax=Microbacterium amylolyticum TaxID=936337 RepID=UPI003CC93DA9
MQIANQMHLAEPTVKSYIASVMSKWNVRTRVQVVLHALGRNDTFITRSHVSDTRSRVDARVN